MPICVFRYIFGYVMYIEKGTNGVFFSIVRCANDCWGFDHCWLLRSCVVRNTKAWGPNKKLGRDVNHVINPLFKVQVFFYKESFISNLLSVLTNFSFTFDLYYNLLVSVGVLLIYLRSANLVYVKDLFVFICICIYTYIYIIGHIFIDI